MCSLEREGCACVCGAVDGIRWREGVWRGVCWRGEMQLAQSEEELSTLHWWVCPSLKMLSPSADDAMMIYSRELCGGWLRL